MGSVLIFFPFEAFLIWREIISFFFNRSYSIKVTILKRRNKFYLKIKCITRCITCINSRRWYELLVERVELCKNFSLVHNIHVGGNQQETSKPRHLKLMDSPPLFSKTNTTNQFSALEIRDWHDVSECGRPVRVCVGEDWWVSDSNISGYLQPGPGLGNI